MRAGKGGCHFYTEGRCAIYHVRPLDCRLFPLDIIEVGEHKFVWIAYTRFCPVKFDAFELLEQAKHLIPQLKGLLVPSQCPDFVYQDVLAEILEDWKKVIE